MRQRGKNQLAPRSYLIGLDLLEQHVAFAGKRRVNIAHPFADVLLRRDCAQLDPRVPQKDTQQLDAGVPSGAKYGYT
jgi:hypothetical protein